MFQGGICSWAGNGGTMNTEAREHLSELADKFSSVIPEVDADAEHDRWQPGIGPFEEENQIQMILDALEGRPIRNMIETEVPYLQGKQRCDLVLDCPGLRLPVEAKLLRFRYDNGNIDPNSFARIFTPFPERRSSSMLTDTKKLYESEFESNGGVLGLYYEKTDEDYKQMTAEAIAEKFCIDVEFWFDFHSLLHLQYQFAGRGRVASIQATEQKMYQIDVQFADTNVRRKS